MLCERTLFRLGRHRSGVVSKLDVFHIFAWPRDCTARWRYAAQLHGFSWFLRSSMFCGWVVPAGDVQWRWIAQHDWSGLCACQRTDGYQGRILRHSLTSNRYRSQAQNKRLEYDSAGLYKFRCLALHTRKPQPDEYDDTEQSSSITCCHACRNSSITHQVQAHHPSVLKAAWSWSGCWLFFIHDVSVAGATPNRRRIPRRLPRSR